MSRKNTPIFEYIQNEGYGHSEVLNYLIDVLKTTYQEIDPSNYRLMDIFDGEIADALFVVTDEENLNAGMEVFLSVDYFDNLMSLTNSHILMDDIHNRRSILAKKINEICYNYNIIFNSHDHAQFIYR